MIVDDYGFANFFPYETKIKFAALELYIFSLRYFDVWGVLYSIWF